MVAHYNKGGQPVDTVILAEELNVPYSAITKIVITPSSPNQRLTSVRFVTLRFISGGS